ncbi:hypothetical protein BDZ94DRAFT_1242756 [Collybia nuda]|uniref:MOSC domain-containing protein n=1 Tax=Collybia nuda TaxID=64659 RepID=A0A9P6CK59_9AGAR|nr:hypothetical protein BDZ94DRAFT_1242756 [Collybia nuda]
MPMTCRGTPLTTAKYTPEGLEHDRRWCILDVGLNRIITAREFPRMVLIHPRIKIDASLPHAGLLHVTFPEDSGCAAFTVPLRPTKDILSTWRIIDEVTLFPGMKPLDGYISQFLPGPSLGSEGETPSSILSTYFGKPVHLIYKGPRIRPIQATVEFPELKATAVYQDGYPLLVLSEESMGDVNREIKDRVGTQGISEAWKEDSVAIRRFRPNIIFSGGGPFAEDEWKEIAIGSSDAPPISLVSKCARCLLPNVSPDTGEADKAVPYKVLMKFRTGLDPIKKMKPCVGCNAVPEEEGIVNVGDFVYVRQVWGE